MIDTCAYLRCCWDEFRHDAYDFLAFARCRFATPFYFFLPPGFFRYCILAQIGHLMVLLGCFILFSHAIYIQMRCCVIAGLRLIRLMSPSLPRFRPSFCFPPCLVRFRHFMPLAFSLDAADISLSLALLFFALFQRAFSCCLRCLFRQLRRQRFH